MGSKLLTSFLGIAVAMLMCGFAPGASDAFLQVYLTGPSDPIHGEATAAGHAGWCELRGYDITVTGAGRATGGGSQQSSLSDMYVLKNVDKASTHFFMSAVSGSVFDSAKIELLPAGTTGTDSWYVKWELEDIAISLYNTSYSEGAAKPTEVIALDYKKITYHYRARMEDGTLSPDYLYWWDRDLNLGGGSLPPVGMAGFEFVTSYRANSGAVPEPGTIALVGWTAGSLLCVRLWCIRRYSQPERLERRSFP